MSNRFKWYVYIRIDGKPKERYFSYPDSETGRQLAVRKADYYNSLFGIKAKVIRERKEVETSHVNED